MGTILPAGVLEGVIDTVTTEFDDEFALVYTLVSPERLNVRALGSKCPPRAMALCLISLAAKRARVIGFKA